MSLFPDPCSSISHFLPQPGDIYSAALSCEDAAVLGELLSDRHATVQQKDLLKAFQKIRKARLDVIEERGRNVLGSERFLAPNLHCDTLLNYDAGEEVWGWWMVDGYKLAADHNLNIEGARPISSWVSAGISMTASCQPRARSAFLKRVCRRVISSLFR